MKSSFVFLQGFHKAVRALPDCARPMQIAELVNSGRVLEVHKRITRDEQLNDLENVIADLLHEKGQDYLEEAAKTAVALEKCWCYADFEATILSALPALLQGRSDS